MSNTYSGANRGGEQDVTRDEDQTIEIVDERDPQSAFKEILHLLRDKSTKLNSDISQVLCDQIVQGQRTLAELRRQFHKQDQQIDDILLKIGNLTIKDESFNYEDLLQSTLEIEGAQSSQTVTEKSSQQETDHQK